MAEWMEKATGSQLVRMAAGCPDDLGGLRDRALCTGLNCRLFRLPSDVRRGVRWRQVRFLVTRRRRPVVPLRCHHLLTVRTCLGVDCQGTVVPVLCQEYRDFA
jgi:hypothetical protein